jgi:periplasmic protein TonB
MKLSTLSSYNLDEVVFENRNKLYGAYALRKSYDSHLIKAILGSLAFFLLLYFGLYLKSAIVPASHPIVIDDPIVFEKGNIEIVIELPPPPQAPVTRVQPRTDHGELQIVARPPQPIVVTPPSQPASVTPPGTGTVETAITPPGTITGTNTITFPPVEVDPPEPATIENLQFMPEFPGGMDALEQYLQNNLEYPDQAYSIGLTGRVVVSFVIGKDGVIKDIKILQSLGFGCDEEAKRVVERMPKWKPGKQNGRDVAVRYTLPIRFALN